MRLTLDPRARHLLRRVPQTNVYSAVELLFLCLLALQCARLFWVFLTPVDPVGEWRAVTPPRASLAKPSDLLSGFDPFFRLEVPSGAEVVTSLNLKLFGVREDRASGRGSAIIGTPDGQQKSFMVGEEVMPGVKLSGVTFDGVTLNRNGAEEHLYLDQSRPAPEPTSVPQSSGPPPLPPEAVAALSRIQFQPRVSGGKVTGVVVQPLDSGTLGATGLAPGDVILSVNGQPVTSAQDARALSGQFGSGDVVLQVERGGKAFPLRIRSNQ